MASEDASVRSSWDLQNLRKQYNQRALAVLTPSQQTRVRQIERQMMGGSLLASASEQSLMGLSQQQQQALSAIYKNDQASAAAINAKFNSGTMSSFSKMIALHGNQKNTSSRMLAVLTPQQKKKWLELSGQKMVLPKIHDPNANSASLFEGY
jgi:Spy/CpxP family protein refolding chaperone